MLRADPKCLILCSPLGGRDASRGIDAVRGEELLGRYLSGLGLGQGDFAAHGASVQLEVAQARVGGMLVVADWHLLGTASAVVSVLENCNQTARAIYGLVEEGQRLPMVVSISVHCAREVSNWFRDHRFNIMLGLAAPPRDVPDGQLGANDQTARAEHIRHLLVGHSNLHWLEAVSQPTEFAIIPASMVADLAGAYPGLGTIAYLDREESTAIQLRRTLEAGAHHVMLDWPFWTVGGERLADFCQAVAGQLRQVFPDPPAEEVAGYRARLRLVGS